MGASATAVAVPNTWQRLKLHPTGFWFVFWGELAERASFYGMRTLLALYMINVLGYAENEGAAIMTFFMAACYVTPLIGGIVADRYLGRYKTILYFSVPYMAGHIILGGIESRPAMFLSLFFLAFGSGSIKPNISTLMGQIYEKQGKTNLLTEAFSYYYAAINIGAAISSLALPVLRTKYGYGVALAVPALLMAIAFVVFAVGKKYYPEDKIEKVVKTKEQKHAEWTTLRRIAGIFLIISVFWLVYDQNASTWIYFTQAHTDLTLWGNVKFEPDQLQGLNPLLIVLFTPIFNFAWNALKRKSGKEVSDTKKMVWGFLIVIACMASISIAGYLAESGKVSAWWIVIATVIITMAELCISVVGLEFAFKQAVPGTKSFVAGVFWLTVTLGDFIGGFMSMLYETKLNAGAYFGLQTLVMVAALFLFVRVARKFEAEEEARAALQTPAEPELAAAH